MRVEMKRISSLARARGHHAPTLRPWLGLFTSAGAAALLQSSLAQAATYYVAPPPTGNDSAPGTEAAPFASMQRAQTAAAAGDTVYFKAGVYAYTRGTSACASQTATISAVELSKSGSAERPINYFAAPGEKPILDFDGIRDSCRIKGILLSGNFIHLRGFELRGVRQNNNLNHESWAIWIQGSNNVIEACDIHDIMGPGVFIQRGSNNLVLNVDSHDNLDELTSNGAGESADGFGCHVREGETGNVFRGCRAWWNADDGYDFINSGAACVVEQSWAWYNGYRPGTLDPIGNGNGFKGGGYGADPATFPDTPAQHVIRQNLSVLNRAAGFYANHHPGPLFFTNNTGYGNRPNFNMLGMDRDGNDITVGVYRNNLAVSGTAFSNRNGADDADNSWTIGGISVSDADFASVSELGLDAPRQADGSLPLLDNFRLAAGSDVIDRGVDVQLPFAGAAPDLGAFESGLPTPPPAPTDDPAGEGVDDGSAGQAGAGGTTPTGTPPTLGVSPSQDDRGSSAGASGTEANSGMSGMDAPSNPTLPGNGAAPDIEGLGDATPEAAAADGCACGLPRPRAGNAAGSLVVALLAVWFVRRSRSAARG